MPLNRGQVVNNRYRITKLLGQGGFGAVYRAWDLNIEASCALKENLDISFEAQKQFRREAVILANLQHPNLPRVRDHFIIPKQGQYLVMDFVDGKDFREKLTHNAGPLPENQVVPWIKQVCNALEYLHGQNPPIIHRDIRPANIKITPQGKAMLVDFGIAKVFDPKLKTTVGARAITPGFSPLEQYGQGNTDARSDIYALGATLYTLLTGEEPPDSIQRNMGTRLVPPRNINSAISYSTEVVIRKAMQIAPDSRYRTVARMKGDLRLSLTPVHVSTSSASLSKSQSRVTQVKSQPKNRNMSCVWISIIGVVIVMLACICLSLWWLWNNGDELFGIAVIDIFTIFRSLL